MSTSPLRIDVPEPGTAPRQLASTPPPPNELHIEPVTWRALASTHADALIVGDGAVARSRVLNFIWPTLRKPIFWCDSRRLSLPDQREGTLVLEDTSALDADHQQQLLEWLHGGTGSPRLIAMSWHPILPLVEDGKFSRELCERFTVVKLVNA
jgi:Sigma-54 interaction domain